MWWFLPIPKFHELWGLFCRASSSWNNLMTTWRNKVILLMYSKLEMFRVYTPIIRNIGWVARKHPHRTQHLSSGSQDPSKNSVQKTVCCYSISNVPDDGCIVPETFRAKNTLLHQAGISSYIMNVFTRPHPWILSKTQEHVYILQHRHFKIRFDFIVATRPKFQPRYWLSFYICRPSSMILTGKFRA